MAKTRTSIKPGEIRNPNGRGKGVPNKTTAEMKEFISAVLSENLDRMRDDFEKMQPSTKWMLLEKFGKYIIPTLAQTQTTNEHSGKIEIIVKYESDNNNAS